MVHLDTTILYIFSKVSQSTVQEGVGKLLETEHREDWRTIVSCGDSWISALMKTVNICTRHAQVQVSQHSNMEWRKEVLECPLLSGSNVQKYDFLGRKSQFSSRVCLLVVWSQSTE